MDGTVGRATAAELTPQGLYALLKLRVDVFVVEQHCAYPELDGRDLEPGTVHLWVGPDDAPAACPAAPGRAGRGTADRAGVHHPLGPRARAEPAPLTAALQEVGDAPCVLDAQEHLTRLYGGFGFVANGPGYDWDGVLHVPMRRPSGRARPIAPRKEDTGT